MNTIFVLICYNETWPKEASRFCGAFTTVEKAEAAQKFYAKELTADFHFSIEVRLIDGAYE